LFDRTTSMHAAEIWSRARGRDLVARVRHVHRADGGGIEQALDVIAKPEDRTPAIGALVGADAFERSDSVVHRVRQQVVGGAVPWDELAIHPDGVELLDAHTCFVPTPVDEHKHSAACDLPVHTIDNDAARLRTTLRTE
jgi:hypothetical protein